MVTSCAVPPTQRKQGHSAAGRLGSRHAEGLSEDFVYFLKSTAKGWLNFPLFMKYAICEPTVSRALLRMRLLHAAGRVWVKAS